LLAMGRFIKKAFGRGYNFKDENWQKMLNGDIFNPKQVLSEDEANKIMIIYDESDPSINYLQIEKYFLKNKIRSKKTKDLGHLSFSKLNEDLKNKIIAWISPKSSTSF
jgi:hypothetical protein